MKLNRHGQATPISSEIYRKVRAKFFEESHQILLDVAYYTGERWGAILQLQVQDVYLDPLKRLVRETITFKASTRKDKATRQVPVHPDLKLRLRAYDPPRDGWLFPSLVKPDEHLTMRAATRSFERALKRAGLDKEGYSSHSTRRGFITSLHTKGVSIKMIQSLTGHKSLNVVSQYVEVTDEQRQIAIALL
jgi:integrase/recombinase XerD